MDNVEKEVQGQGTQGSEEKKDEKQEASLSPFQQAENLAKRLENANREAAEILRKQEELYAKQMFSGHSQAGDPAPTQQPVEQSPEDYANSLLGVNKSSGRSNALIRGYPRN